MPREITHLKDPETGYYAQVVSPKRLREILDADGEDYSRPSHFGPHDEWEVADDRGERIAAAVERLDGSTYTDDEGETEDEAARGAGWIDD